MCPKQKRQHISNILLPSNYNVVFCGFPLEDTILTRFAPCYQGICQLFLGSSLEKINKEIPCSCVPGDFPCLICPRKPIPMLCAACLFLTPQNETLFWSFLSTLQTMICQESSLKFHCYLRGCQTLRIEPKCYKCV